MDGGNNLFRCSVCHNSSLIVFQLGAAIFFSMARDGVAAVGSRVHPKFRTPHITTILTGLFVAVVAAATNIDEVVDLCNIGTLFEFVWCLSELSSFAKFDPAQGAPFPHAACSLVPVLRYDCGS